ncbi:MAG: S8/S53 family peptidase [Ilumatobacteraceae bacterium]
MPPVLRDYDGPLGGLEPELARRRIAVASDEAGRICLVRPDSVVLEFEGEAYPDVAKVIDADDGLEFLGGRPEEPPGVGIVGARDLSMREAPRPVRWPTKPLVEMMERLESDTCRVRPNQVYLADGVARHFGLLGGGSTGTPGFVNPASLESTVRPAPAPRHLASRLGLPGHRRPNVLVLDTGLRTFDARAEHPALDNCVVHRPWRSLASVGRWDDEDEPDDDGVGRLDYQAGHGTFISGIIRQLCPDALVHHRGVLTSYGDGDDASVIAAIERAVRQLGDDIDIVVMSFGTYGENDQPPPMAGAIEALLQHSLVIASAGNDGTNRRYFPAALPGVIGVGALGPAGRAAFSNFGSWVDACAIGVDVVSTFFTDFDDRRSDDRLVDEYRGWARWSGTSFSGPKVAAAVAQELYLHGGTAKEAWRRLSPPTALRLPDLGIVVNV